MKAIAYLTFSAFTFIAVVGMHVISYKQELSAQAFYLALVPTILLCIPLVLLFLRVKKKGGIEDVWQRFWYSALRYCPRWIWGSMTVAWCIGVLSFIRTIFGHQLTISCFRTAWLMIPAGAALSYAVTLARTPKHEET
jgi:hypothetical protein